jgi:hypothetical protein
MSDWKNGGKNFLLIAKYIFLIINRNVYQRINTDQRKCEDME